MKSQMIKFSKKEITDMIQIDKVIFDNFVSRCNMGFYKPRYDRDILCGQVWILVRTSKVKIGLTTKYRSNDRLFEGEGIDVFFNSKDDVQDFIKSNYEVTD